MLVDGVMGMTHMCGGAAAGLGVGALSGDPGVGLLCGAVGAVTSMTPDLDHPSARAVRVLGPVGWVVCRVLRFVSYLLTGRTHRGITHSLLFAATVAGIAGWVASVWIPADTLSIAAAALAGVLTALLGDAVTKAGLDYVLWPLEWRLHVPAVLRVRTGGRVEKWVVMPVMCLLCVVGLGLVVRSGGV